MVTFLYAVWNYHEPRFQVLQSEVIVDRGYVLFSLKCNYFFRKLKKCVRVTFLPYLMHPWEIIFLQRSLKLVLFIPVQQVIVKRFSVNGVWIHWPNSCVPIMTMDYQSFYQISFKMILVWAWVRKTINNSVLGITDYLSLVNCCDKLLAKARSLWQQFTRDR